jgi:hypothetical protein
VQTRFGIQPLKWVSCFLKVVLQQAHVLSHYRAHTVRVADLSNNLRATNKCR